MPKIALAGTARTDGWVDIKGGSGALSANADCRPAPGPVPSGYGLDSLRFVEPAGIGDAIQARAAAPAPA